MNILTRTFAKQTQVIIPLLHPIHQHGITFIAHTKLRTYLLTFIEWAESFRLKPEAKVGAKDC